jgi:hypothetical protein
LRQRVEQLAIKKASNKLLSSPTNVNLPNFIPVGQDNFQTCQLCNLNVPALHLDKHIGVHMGEVRADQPGDDKQYLCDLCGNITFQTRIALYKHWRTCPNITESNLNASDLNNDELLNLVESLLQQDFDGTTKGKLLFFFYPEICIFRIVFRSLQQY